MEWLVIVGIVSIMWVAAVLVGLRNRRIRESKRKRPFPPSPMYSTSSSSWRRIDSRREIEKGSDDVFTQSMMAGIISNEVLDDHNHHDGIGGSHYSDYGSSHSHDHGSSWSDSSSSFGDSSSGSDGGSF